MRSAILASVLSIALAGCAANLTGAASPGVAPPASIAVAVEAPSGTYRLDPTHTSVIWRVQHLGLAMYTGRFNTVSATLAFDAADPARSELAVEIEAASVDTGHATVKPGSAFDAEIAREALGAARTPKIAFVATAIERTGPATGRVTGDLTFNGQTRPLTLDVTFYGARRHPLTQRQLLGFAARTTLTRSQWGSRAWSGFIGDEVDLIIETEFEKT